jgi:hypothetical protein
MKERTIAAQAAELLAGLGSTPDEIAAMLLGAGYKGKRYRPGACPCGSCLYDHLGQTVLVGWFEVGTGKSSTRLAQHVSALIRAFDAGKYPQLVARP